MLVIPAELRPVVRRRLKDEYFVWLTTVGANLTPQPRPVWFIWKDDSFLIYSQPKAHKIHQLKLHPLVALHFNSDASADNDVLVFTGEAHIDAGAPPAHKVRAYMNKYREGIGQIKLTPEEFGQTYSAAIRIVPTSVRGW